MTRDQVIRINPFPAVVQAADVQALRRPGAEQGGANFVAGYLGYDGRARHALTETVTCLAQRERGGAFWLNGVFGCGKSHLLGVLTLLSDGLGHEAFAVAHPFLGPLLPCIPRRLVVHFSLDEYDAARWSLEAAFWRELDLEWEKRGFGVLNLDRSGSRGETFAVLEEMLRSRGLQGLTVCLDELSLFLGGRDHHGLQSDAAFLQFLGQYARRAPLCLFAALQKNVEDIAGLESYSLGQIRDRFTTLSLSLANLPAILEQRLVTVLDDERLSSVCETTWAGNCRALPRQEFGPREWKSLYPFHPATVSLVEQVVSRFFSRTRSALLFCTGAVDISAPVEQRVPPDALWDYVEPELESHPDLRPLAGIWESWRDGAASIVSREADIAPLTRVMKFLLLNRISGQTTTPVTLANALELDAGLCGDGNYEYARHLLERLRARAAFLAVERGEEPLQDRYAVDTGQRVGEMLRRQMQASLETLDAEDARVPAAVLACCREEPLPLAELTNGPKSYSIFWHNAPRRIMVELWIGGAADAVSNRVAALCEPGSPDDALLLIVPPFAESDLDVKVLAGRLAEDARPALWLWRPRPPLRDETVLAREITAANLLEADPQLLDNRRGRAVLDRLKAEAPGRENQLRHVALRLLREGTLYVGNGPILEAAELAASDTWTGLLEAVADFSLPHLFGHFARVAPRARLLTPSNADALCLEILRRPPAEPFFAPSLERLARHIGEPLGVARAAAGRWKISPPTTELAGALVPLIQSGITLAALECLLAKRPWGLRPEQTAIALCSLLRLGEAVALDGRGQELVPGQIGLPLRRSVHTLKPGRLVSPDAWPKVASLLGHFGGDRLGSQSFEEQEKARLCLLDWRERTEAELNLSRARAAQLRRQLGHSPESWSGFESVCETLGNALEVIPGNGTAGEVLESAARLNLDSLAPALDRWREAASELEAKLYGLLTQHALLTHSDLVCPAELSDERGELLLSLGAGEAVLRDPTLMSRLSAWGEKYHELYAAWHAAQHQSERWNSLRRLANSDSLRALERLATLRNRPFSWGADAHRMLDTELGKYCGRLGPPGSGEAACCACGLLFGVRVMIGTPQEVEQVLEAGLTAIQETLREPLVLDLISRRGSAWVQWDGHGESLLSVVTDPNLALLDEALRPRRRVERTVATLLDSLNECRTRTEIESSFALWLDGGDNLAADDEVVLLN